GKGILHGRHDDVTDARVSPAAAAENPDAEDLLGTRVVGDLKPRLLLDHVNLSISPGARPPGDPPPRTGGAFAGHRSQADLSYYLAFSRISATRQRLVADS